MPALTEAGLDPMETVPSPIEIRVQAVITAIPTLRAVVADLAARADFDIDAVADLRMAVDEASATLVTLASPRAPLCCCFRVTPEQIMVTLVVAAEPGATVACNTFGWRVLTTLMDRVEVFRPSDQPGEGRIGIRMWRSRDAGTAGGSGW